MIRNPAFLVLLLPCSLGCSAYWQDRGRDSGDVFSCSLVYGYGVTVQAMPIHTGLGGNATVLGAEDGEWVSWQGFIPDFSSSSRLALPVVGSWVQGPRGGTSEERDKSYGSIFLFGLYPLYTKVSELPPPHYWTRVEIAAALGYGIKAGFNPGELLDLVLGFFGIDLYGDDLSRRPPSPDPRPPEDK